MTEGSIPAHIKRRDRFGPVQSADQPGFWDWVRKVLEAMPWAR